MRRSLQRAVILSAGILVLGLAPLFGWGETADRLVANRAVDTLPQEMQPFFYANRQFLVEHVGPAEENRSEDRDGAPHGFHSAGSLRAISLLSFAARVQCGEHEIQPARAGAIRNSAVGNRSSTARSLQTRFASTIGTRCASRPQSWRTT